jgi:hypothetical protein
MKLWRPHFTFTNVLAGRRHLSRISLDSHPIRVYNYSWFSRSLPKQEETETQKNSHLLSSPSSFISTIIFTITYH